LSTLVAECWLVVRHLKH